VTFGATDAPLKHEQLEKDGLVQWPMVMGAIVPVVNLEGIKPGELVLSGEVLGDIYLGKIKKWDDAAIAKLNPKLKLPADAITVVRRSDGSGTTFNFTDYLSKSNAEWKPRSAPAPRSNGRPASAPRAMKALPAISARPRTRSVTSNMPTPSRTS
jgi:phosphate transport system substrate-binding protein